MTIYYDVLSVWEIAHRWHDVDPNTTDPKALPLEVQDTLRLIARKMAYHELRTCSHKGITNTIQTDLMRFDEFESLLEDTMSENDKSDSYENYVDDMERRYEAHNKIIEGFESCYAHRQYDKNKLDSTFTLNHELGEFCKEENIPLPKFWFPDGMPDNEVKPQHSESKKLRANQIDKTVCQAVAKTLWDIDPSITIASMISHRAIQDYAGGTLYVKKTLRKWLSEVDPRDPKKKIGRPKKPTITDA